MDRNLGVGRGAWIWLGGRESRARNLKGKKKGKKIREIEGKIEK